jgi:hypothetical protein
MRFRRRREAVELAAGKDIEDDVGRVDAVGGRFGAGSLDRRPQIGRMFTNQAKRLLKGPE